jgi:hypothetical protein
MVKEALLLLRLVKIRKVQFLNSILESQEIFLLQKVKIVKIITESEKLVGHLI